MMLDTCALSAFADGDEKLLRCLSLTHRLCVPIIVLGEYRYGIRQSKYRTTYERWLEDALSGFDLIPLMEPSTSHYAAVVDELKRMGQPIPTNDVWIAALCREHGLPIVSEDAHFDCVPGLRRFSWR